MREALLPGMDYDTALALERPGALEEYQKSLASGKSAEIDKETGPAARFERAFRETQGKFDTFLTGVQGRLMTALSEPLEKLNLSIANNQGKIQKALDDIEAHAKTVTIPWIEGLISSNWAGLDDLVKRLEELDQASKGWAIVQALNFLSNPNASDTGIAGLITALERLNEESKDWAIVKALNYLANPFGTTAAGTLGPALGGTADPGAGASDAPEPDDNSGGIWGGIKRFYRRHAPAMLGGDKPSDGSDWPKANPDSTTAVKGVGKWWTPDRMAHAADRLVGEAGLSPIGASALVARWAAVESRDGPASVNPRSGAAGIH